jgi:hypothetical protein
VGIPLYFSLTSALYFAWRPIVMGFRSISAQLRKYILRPTGWVKFIAGVQSVVGLYLVVLSLVTYFY